MPRAFTRAVSPRLPECELTHLDRVPIDPRAADLQHSAYEQALADAGLDVVRLAELPDHPDAVFVEDTALLLGDHAIILRPGVESRAGESDSSADGLAAHFELNRLDSGCLDGGDVLRIGRKLYVGRSTRTDGEGLESLRAAVAPLGYQVIEAEPRGCLHLKSGATFAGADGHGVEVLLYSERAVDPRQFAGVEAVAVADGEEAAANCLRVGSRLILPAGNPRTAGMLRDRGFQVAEVDVSELQKAEAGVTCMSLIDERA